MSSTFKFLQGINISWSSSLQSENSAKIFEMAEFQLNVNIQSVIGLEKENFDKFERQLSSSIGAATTAARRHLNLQWHSKGDFTYYN